MSRDPFMILEIEELFGKARLQTRGVLLTLQRFQQATLLFLPEFKVKRRSDWRATYLPTAERPSSPAQFVHFSQYLISMCAKAIFDKLKCDIKNM
jgi:hypothetical protein